MSDMVVRSHRVKTVKSGPIEVSDNTTSSTHTDTITVPPPPPPPPPPPCIIFEG